MKTVKLIGGTRDGESVEVNTWQPLIYLTKKITLEEFEALKIDESISWKPPEEVYIRNNNGYFVYEKTVNYKPSDS